MSPARDRYQPLFLMLFTASIDSSEWQGHDFFMTTFSAIHGAPCRNVEFDVVVRRYLPFLGVDEQLNADASLRELGLDSMGVVELLADLENGYGVRFRDEALSMETFATARVLRSVLSGMVPFPV